MDRSGQEFTDLSVRVSRAGNIITVSPVDPSLEAVEALATIFANLAEHGTIHSGGVQCADLGDGDRLIGMFLFAGGTYGRRKVGNMDVSDYVGAVRIYLDVTEETDLHALQGLRSFLYFTGIRIAEGSTPDVIQMVPGKNCKICHGPLDRILEWEHCDACAAACDHQYEEGIGQANGQLVMLPFCKQCGRGDPSWTPDPDPLGIAEVVERGGLDALLLQHPDGSSTLLTRKPDATEG